jgi:Ca-activated chloride channel homolog
MRFALPQILWLLLASPLLALAGLWVKHRRERALSRFAGGAAFVSRFDAEVSRHRRAVRWLLLHVAIVASVLALARPQWGGRVEPVTARGADIVIALDSSLSMAAEDVPPQRLAHAKHAISALLSELGGDRVALVTFAGQATLNCPLTIDHAAVQLFLESVDVDSIPLGGTALRPALKVALQAFNTPEGAADDRGRAIVVFSDGEDHEGGVEDAVAELKKQDVAVYAVGCGTEHGAPIPLRGGDGSLAGYKKDRQGKVVTSRLESSTLEQLALGTKGHYFRATSGDLEVREISKALSELAHGEMATELRARYEDRFQFPLLAAWLALAAEAVLGDRKRARRLPRRTEESA